MNPELENRLRQALRPVDPPEGFAARVLARVAAQNRPRSERRPAERGRPRRLGFVPLALAAALAAALVIGIRWHEQRELQGLEARRQLIEALRVTSQKLDLAWQIVNSPPATTGPARSTDPAAAERQS